MKVLFFGTPDLSVPFLSWLSKNQSVVGVVTRADKPVGRGLEITAPPVKEFATQNKIPVFQPAGPWTPETVRQLKDLNADVGIVVAYGRILPRDVFMAPRLGCINIHFSLLPKYRGAAPIQWSLINGDTKSGASAFWLEEGLDSGPLFAQKEIPIALSDNEGTLREKLIQCGLEVLGSVMKDLSAGRIVKNPQQGEVVMAPQLQKESSLIDWNKPAENILNLIRGISEWPVARTSGGIKIFKASYAGPTEARHSPGTIVGMEKDRGYLIQTGDGRVLIEEVQPPGKKRMSAWAYIQGARLNVDEKI